MVWKQLWRSLAVVGVGVVAAASASAQPLTARLSVGKDAYTTQEAMAFRLTLSNVSGGDVYVLYWKTPFRGIKDDIFEVYRDGREVLYTGRHYKRPAPGRADWQRIPAGGSLTASFDLSAHYDMMTTGDYSISYRIPYTRVRSQAGTAPETTTEATTRLRSEAVSVHIDGLDPEAAESLEESLRALAEAEPAVPSPQAVTPNYRSCSSSRRSSTTAALQSAESYAAEASTFLSNNTSSTARYVRWFGTFSSTRYNTVRSHFTKLKSTTSTKTYTFDCSCTEGAYAYVYPNRPYEVFLCQAFWPAPRTGQDSKAGTIIHETSHFSVVAGTDDHAYGASACRSLAQSSPSLAVDNADSHEYFCELR